MKNRIKIAVLFVVVLVMTSCGHDKRKPNVQYMPDMYVSVGYETYSANAVGDMTARHPVQGTIARGQVPYDYPDTLEGYAAAKETLKSPLATNEANLANGKKMYDIYCISCHGPKGISSESVLAKREKFEGVPNYKDRDLTEGSIYHVIMYGKGSMGSHASQLTTKERWQVVQYVQQLKNK